MSVAEISHFSRVHENKNCAFSLSSLLASFIVLRSLKHVNNGFNFDEASYSIIF